MDISKPRNADANFSHYLTVNGENIVLEAMAEGLDDTDGQFNIFMSNSKDPNSFERLQDSTPSNIELVMDEKSAGAMTGAASSDSGETTSFTSTSHGMTTGEVVTIAGTTDYNGSHVVTVVDANTFKIGVAFTSDQSGTWTKKVYVAVSVPAMYFRYLRCDWVKGSVTEGSVFIKMHNARTEGPFNKG